MELSINIANLMKRYDLERCLEIYKQAGFTSVDYSLEDLVKNDAMLNGEDYRDLSAEIRKKVESAGMTINQTHAPFTFSHWDDEEHYRTVIFPRLVRSLEISGIFGAKVSVIHPLHHRVYHGHEEELFQLNMEFYRSLIPYCREYGVCVGVENMWQRDPLRKYVALDTCNTKEEFVRYIDTLNSEYMVACLDVGHVGLPMQDDEAQDFIRALGHDRLKALHIHDNDYIGDLHWLPYLGKMNWSEITKALGEINYSGDFTYEVSGSFLNTMDDEFVQIGANYMGDVGKHLVSEIERNRQI